MRRRETQTQGTKWTAPANKTAICEAPLSSNKEKKDEDAAKRQIKFVVPQKTNSIENEDCLIAIKFGEPWSESDGVQEAPANKNR